jgi:hypothetical protein
MLLIIFWCIYKMQEYHYIVKEVLYDENKYTSSIDAYYEKSIKNIKLLIFVVMLDVYLILFRHIETNSDEIKIKECTEIINKYIQEKKDEWDKIDNIKYFGYFFHWSKIRKVINTIDNDKATNMGLIHILKFNGEKPEILETLKKEIETKHALLGYYFTNRILNIANEFHTDVVSMLNFIFASKYKRIHYIDFIQIELEQLSIIGIPGTHDIDKCDERNDCDCDDEKYGNFCSQVVILRCNKKSPDVLYYVTLYENDDTNMNNLIVSMFSIKLPSGLINFYICKNISYCAEKYLRNESELSNVSLKLHSFSLYYFKRYEICTTPLRSMREIFEKYAPAYGLTISDARNTKLNTELIKAMYKKYGYEPTENFKCNLLEPNYCVICNETSSFINYWKISDNEYEIKEEKNNVTLKKKISQPLVNESVFTKINTVCGGYYHLYISNKRMYSKFFESLGYV